MGPYLSLIWNYAMMLKNDDHTRGDMFLIVAFLPLQPDDDDDGAQILNPNIFLM